MITSRKFWKLALFLSLGSTASLPSVFAAGEPDANDDSYPSVSSLRVDANDTLTILDPTLLANDDGDDIVVDGPVGTTSSGGAELTRNTASITYDPSEVSQYEALDSGDSAIDTFDYTISGSESPASAGDERATVSIRVDGVNDSPSISSLNNGNLDDDDDAVTPFSGETIADPDSGETLTVTVTINPEGDGEFTTLSGFSPTGTAGEYQRTGSATTVTNALRALEFTPTKDLYAVDSENDAVLTVEVDDGDLSVTDSLTLTVTSINDDPTITPTSLSTANLFSGAIVSPFTSVGIDDVDVIVPESSESAGSGSDIYTAEVVLAGGADPGTVSSSNFNPTGTANTYSYSATIDLLELAIEDLEYIAPGVSGTFTVTLTLTDPNGGVSNALVYTAEVTAPVSGVTGVIQDQQVADNGSIVPFSTLVFNSFGTSKTVSITIDDADKGTLAQLGGVWTQSGATYSMVGDAVQATESIQDLVFVPTENRIALTGSATYEVTSFNITVGSTNVTGGDPIRVRVVPINDSPTIAGISPTIRTDDDDPVYPFASVSLADVDESGAQNLTVTVSFIGEDVTTGQPLAGGGTLTDDIYDSTGSDSVTFSGTPAEVQTIIRGLLFTPDPSRNQVGERETVSFSVSVDDGKGGTALNNNTDVIVTSVNGAPLIKNIPAPSQQPFPVAASQDIGSGLFTALPFERLEVDDEDNITLTISLDPAKGTLSGTGLTDNGAGEYELGPDSPANVTTDLQAIEFASVDPASAGVETTFTLTASDTVNTVSETYTIVLRERNLAHIVTSASDSGPGSLREAIGLAGRNDFIVFDFPSDDFPVTIDLSSTLEITKNLTIVGSGVKELTISGGDTVALFSVSNEARLVLERMTLKDGFSPSFGGAVAVDLDASLVARYCTFEGNSAGQYGGAIDIFFGDLLVENCLFVGNSVEGSEARGGGAVSIYANGKMEIRNSTFYQNSQGYEVGFGGGALFVENPINGLSLEVLVEHCTFSDNFDNSFSGSAIHSKNTDGEVQVRNTILVGLEEPLDDEGQPIPQGRLIDVSNGGAFLSLGGNIASDATTTTYTQGGTAQNITLLNAALDHLSTDPLVAPLADNGGVTRSCNLESGSPAIDSAKVAGPTIDSTAIDQRGYWRDEMPDVGAVEADSFERINVNEVFVNVDSGDTPFIEFYVPRDSVALNLEDIELYIDGSLNVTFGDLPLEPGAGTFSNVTIPFNSEKGRIELRNTLGQVLHSVDYVGKFADQGTELDTLGQSMTRYALYEGGLLPHQRIVERITGTSGGDETSPGNDVTGAPLGGGNAPPIAVVDLDEAGLPIYAINADETLRPDVVVNDIEFDRADILKVTEVTEISSGTTINNELFLLNGSGSISFADLPLADGTDTTFGAQQADISIDADGSGILYDPTASDDFIGLALGETATDIWAYTIGDFDADNPATARSRGGDATESENNIIKATTYFAVVVTGINEAPTTGLDTASTEENQAIRLLADTDLLSPAPFNFGDQPADFQDFDATGTQVTLLPPAPTVSLLDNDDDVDSDDSNRTIRLIAVHTTATPGDLDVTTSELGAAVTLDIRADRRETSVLYDPRGSATLDALAAGETATDRFFYSVVDRHGARTVGEVVITVTGVNDKPTANDDSDFIANEDESLEITGASLLANDTDPDQNGTGPDDMPNILLPFPTNSALGATLGFDGTTITYDPRSIDEYESLARNETLVDTFEYSIEDTFGGVDTATVTLTVAGENDAPVASDDDLSLFENQTSFVGTLDANALLANDVEVDINGSVPDDDPWVLPQRELVTPLGAILDIFPDGSYRYNADTKAPAIESLYEGEIAIEMFPYTVIDNFRTTASDDAFKVEGNRTDISLPVLINDAVVGTAPTIIEGYTEDTNDSSVVIIESANHALRNGLLVQIQGYEGDGDYNGVYPVTSVDRDHFSISVPYEASAPLSVGTWRPWVEITALTGGDQGGSVVSTADGQTIIYTPVTDFYGIETFTYTIEDGVGGQDVGRVAVDVRISPFNGILDSKGESYRIGMGQTAVEVDVLANDNTLPAQGSALSILSVSPTGGATGTATISGTSDSLIYTPPSPVFVGSETFEYTVSGGGTSTSVATVTFQVEDRTDLLSGSDDAYFIVSGSSDNLLPVLDNDANLPSFPVSSTLDSVTVPGSGGVATIDGDQINYTPPPAPFLGIETFEYTSVDASGASTTQTVRIQVVDDVVNFYAQADNYRVVAGSAPVLLPVLSNDGTVQNDSAILTIEKLGLDTDSPPDVARVSIAGDGNFIEYTPPSSATTEDFNYEITYGSNVEDDPREAKITIEVVDAFDLAPDAGDDAFSVEKNAAPVSLDVLRNDLPYPDAGYEWTISTADTTGSAGGTVSITGGNSITYTPVEGFVGIETFSYTIADSFGATDTATVTVNVGSLMTAPDAFAVLENSSDNLLPVLMNDDLLDRFASEYTISALGTPDQGGAVVLSGAGPDNRVLYTPAADFSGEETFGYTVVDSTGGTVDGLVTVTVLAEESDRDSANLTVELTGVNDLPVLFGFSDKSTTDKQAINPFAGVSITDVDEGGNQLQSVTLSYDASFGSLSAPGMTMTGAGSYQMLATPAAVTTALNAIVFTPFENLIDYIDWAGDNTIGDVDFTLSVDDYNLSTSDGPDAPIVDVTTVNVEPINDAPTLVGSLSDLFLQVNALPRAILLTPIFDDVDDDVPGGELTWTVSGNTNALLFASVSVDQAKQLLVIELAPDQFGVADITVRGTDRGGLFVEDTFTVTVDGPPVIELEEGQDNPDSPTYVQGSAVGSRRDYRQSFIVRNDGVLPAEAFILHVTGLDQPVDGISLFSAEYSSDDNGTPEFFSDDTRSSDGVAVLQQDTYEYSVKYDQPLEPGESIVVHLTYRALSLSTLTDIAPAIRVELTTATPLTSAGTAIIAIPVPETGEVELNFVIEKDKSYVVQSTETLGAPWNTWDLNLPVSDFDREISILDDGLYTAPHPSLTGQRFYRLVEVIVE